MTGFHESVNRFPDKAQLVSGYHAVS